MKINFNKSEILAQTPKALQRPPSTTQFVIARDYINCLGIKIERSPSLLYNLNYPSLIAKIIKQLDLWTDLPLSFFGRAHLIKIVSFTQLPYPLHTIPLLLRHKDLTKAMQQFLWQKRRPRIQIRKLYLSKAEGGLGIPNLQVYNIAYLLRYAMDWLTDALSYINCHASCRFLPAASGHSTTRFVQRCNSGLADSKVATKANADYVKIHPHATKSQLLTGHRSRSIRILGPQGTNKLLPTLS